MERPIVFPSAEADEKVSERLRKEEIRSNLTLQLCDFSNTPVTESRSTAEGFTDTIRNLDLSCILFGPLYFDHPDYVQFEISANFSYHYFKYLHCFVSIIDNAGNKRFTRSFSKYRENKYQLRVALWEDKYISLQTLLKDPTELLPNDILTIDVEILLVIRSTAKEFHFTDSLINFSYKKESQQGGSPDKKLRLISNSVVAKTLCEVSTVFRDMFAYTAEDDSEILEIPEDDARSLNEIFKIVRGKKYEVRFGEIFDLLKVSDKYDILNMPEVCRQIIKEFLSSEKRLKPSLRYSGVFHEMLIQNAKDCWDTTVLELVEAFVESIDPEEVEFPRINSYPIWDGKEMEKDNWKKEEELFFLRLELTYEQSLGFKFTWVLDDPKKDHYYSYFN